MTDEIIEPVVVEKTPEQVAIEKEAHDQGWAPKEEFHGNEADWVDADTFVQRGRQINPILRKNNERLQKEIDKYKKDLDSLKISVEEFKKFTKDANEKKLANYETELSALREQKKQAISAGDGELAVSLDDQMDAVKEAKAASKEEAKQQPKEEPAKPTEINPAIAAWVENNSWYNKSKAMSETTNEIAVEIRNNNPSITEARFLELLDKELEQTFTLEKLGRKSKPRSPVEGAGNGNSGNAGTKGKSYNDLPADAKAACDDFIKSGVLKNKEEYLKFYFE